MGVRLTVIVPGIELPLAVTFWDALKSTVRGVPSTSQVAVPVSDPLPVTEIPDSVMAPDPLPLPMGTDAVSVPCPWAW
jgi:hypothetical protein